MTQRTSKCSICASDAMTIVAPAPNGSMTRVCLQCYLHKKNMVQNSDTRVLNLAAGAATQPEKHMINNIALGALDGAAYEQYLTVITAEVDEREKKDAEDKARAEALRKIAEDKARARFMTQNTTQPQKAPVPASAKNNAYFLSDDFPDYVGGDDSLADTLNRKFDDLSESISSVEDLAKNIDETVCDIQKDQADIYKQIDDIKECVEDLRDTLEKMSKTFLSQLNMMESKISAIHANLYA